MTLANLILFKHTTDEMQESAHTHTQVTIHIEDILPKFHYLLFHWIDTVFSSSPSLLMTPIALVTLYILHGHY
jgi:hypothetical protein